MLFSEIFNRFLRPRKTSNVADRAATAYLSCEAVRCSFHGLGVVFFHTHTGKILQANRTGAFIWNELRRGKTAAEISEAVVCTRNATPDQAWTDTNAFLTMLENANIVRRAKGA